MTSQVQDDNAAGGVTITGAISGQSYLIRVSGVAAENWNHEATVWLTVVAH